MSRLPAADGAAVASAVQRHRRRVTPGIHDITAFWARQNQDTAHRELLAPLLPATGPSGLVAQGSTILARWGSTDVPEMAFSVTKSVVSLLAGVAYDDGLLHPDDRVAATVAHPALEQGSGPRLTWEHLLQQTSQWDGALWGKPAAVDAQSRREGDEPVGGPPGSGWAYNDVRVNLLCLALTIRFGRPLPDVLADRVLGPLGGSDSWSWPAYRGAVVRVRGRDVPVVGGGAHWGGGLCISTDDLALIGRLYLRRGAWAGRRVVSEDWMARTWTPCRVRPGYGYLWWLNDDRTLLPDAPATGRCARGNLGRHLLWLDPARELLVVSRWGEDSGRLVTEVSTAVPRTDTADRAL